MNVQRDPMKAIKRSSAPLDGSGPDKPDVSNEAEREQADEYTVRYTHSAGGVAYRLQKTPARLSIQVALIATDRECRRWQLPKGRLYPSEEPLTAALREVEEETGLETRYESFLKTVRYEYLDTYARTVPERVYKKSGLLSAASGWRESFTRQR